MWVLDSLRGPMSRKMFAPKCWRRFPLADAQVRRDLALVFRKDKALSRAALAFIDIAVKHKSTEELVHIPSR